MQAPIWISHRGYCASATENTAEAFRAALDLGFDHLETDLRCTADGHLVLAHDGSLTRTAKRPVMIETSTRAQLRKITLNNGERLLFFDEFLEEFSAYQWILDIKPEQGTRVLAGLSAWWQDSRCQDFFDHRARFLLWHPQQQLALLRNKPQAVCMAPIRDCQRAGLFCLLGLPGLARIRPGVTYALPPQWHGLELLRPSVIARYRSKGARVLAYLPEDQSQAQLALDLGVDEILTNHKPLLPKGSTAASESCARGE